MLPSGEYFTTLTLSYENSAFKTALVGKLLNWLCQLYYTKRAIGEIVSPDSLCSAYLSPSALYELHLYKNTYLL